MDWRFKTHLNQTIAPLDYNDGRNQLDVINDVLEALDEHDIVQLHGAVGTGKSVIALHVISEHHKGIISVPTKNLEDQYVDNYCGETGYKVTARNGEAMNVNNLRGRSNFRCPNPPPSINQKHVKCDHERLPCTRHLIEPETRAGIAQNCPHWSPIYDPKNLPEAFNTHNKTIHKYQSISGVRAYYETKQPCPYYKQFRHFIPDGAIIMNSAKWEAETWIARKPKVPVEIIDEADAFLDGLTYELSFTNRTTSLLNREKVFDESETTQLEIELRQYYERYKNQEEFELVKSSDLESMIKGVFKASETSSSPRLTNLNMKLGVLLSLAEYVYAIAVKNRATTGFKFYIPRLDITLNELLERSGKIILMSATHHTPINYRDIFNIQPEIIEAQKTNPGTLYLMTPKDGWLPNITYKTWKNRETRHKYHQILENQLRVAAKPCYVLVHAFRYLPDRYKRDKTETHANYWTRPEHPEVKFSTRMDRGVDLKDNQCRSIILLKHPYPSLGDRFLKTLRKQVGDRKFWRYYRDIANRELLQQCGRAIRNKEDWCQVYSPDYNVVKTLKKIWQGKLIQKNYHT